MSNKLGVFALLIIIFAVPATVFIARQQQNTQQEAGGVIPTILPLPSIRPGCYIQITCPPTCANQVSCVCKNIEICPPSVTPTITR